MTDIPRAASREEISKWVEDAASAEPSYRYPATGGPGGEGRDFHAERIEASLVRARRKTFVKMLKPFRGMFRNQGAVNDSLIEAVHHLAAQNEELMERMNELRVLVSNLRNQMRRTPREETVPESETSQGGEVAGTDQPPAERTDPAAADRKA